MALFKDMELANAVWAHAKLHLSQDKAFLHRLAAEFTARLNSGEEMAAQCVSNVTWSLAKLGIKNEEYCWVSCAAARMVCSDGHAVDVALGRQGQTGGCLEQTTF